MNSAERREARYQRRKAARMAKKAAALREYGDFETVFSFERLYESYRASVRGVGWKASTQRYKAASLALPNRIDHYIKDVLGMKYYARYMDDGCIISESKAELEICLRELRRLCAEHGIRLNPKKTQIIKLTRGFTFVKVRFRYGANGKVVRRATYKGIRHMRKKLRIFRRWVDSGRMTAADVETSLVSWRGHMKRFHSYHMEQSVERLYRELFKGG